ncbi:MAG: DNA polymerase III subunit alpha [Planctomycetes bacterium]|nr:DNA polymerase III subunit alpha [Planctomycetota bacterium]
MQNSDFVHLHVHSDYSLLDGNCRLDDLVKRTGELGMDSVALTDHGNLFGSVAFYKAARKNGIKPLIGMEGYVAAGSRFGREKAKTGKNSYHVTLLARTNEGFQNLIKLSSAAYTEGFYYRPRMDRELLQRWGSGLICLSGCLGGELIQTMRTDGMEGAKRIIAEYKELFGADNYYLELMDNGIDLQVEANARLIELAEQTGTPLVATNDVHYLLPQDYEAQDVMLCIGTGKLRTDPNRFKMGSRDLFLRSPEEMMTLFRHQLSAIENTRVIADRCQVDVSFDNRFLPRFETPEGLTSEQYFRQLCYEGIERLYPGWGEKVEQRLKYEMDVIIKMGFVDYFLIVWDFIRYARENGIPVGPGRGSAAGSIVAYSLGITKLDPLAYDLLFERFLNAERISMPDIDIDFCKDGREKVIDYVARKYGHDNVAQIITFGTMAAKGVIRDVGRALNVPLPEVDAICKKIPGGPGVTLSKSLEADEELRQLRDANDENRELFDIALKVEGAARHSSVHAAGVIITDAPLTERVPIQKNGDTVTTQWTMDVCEEVGLLKMDFLGLRTLTIIDKAIKNIEKTTGRKIDVDTLPLDDPKAYELFRRAETVGVFQLESNGMRELLKKLEADRFDDVIAVLALYRPGPLGSGMHEMYCKRKHGEEKIEYLHPLLEPILEESNGVILYQEQVMRIAASLSGFSLNEADGLRKAMGKKKKEILDKFKQKFVDGAAGNGVDPAIATQIWEQIEYFAGYGFNKSHSAAYALVTYQTAWLKANYPVEYMAALLTCEMVAIEKTVEYIEECRVMGIEILPPDVNKSHYEFEVEDAKIRYALGAIRGAGQKPSELIAQAREQDDRPFVSIYDLCERVDTKVMNKGCLEALIHGGALDSLEGNRAQNLAVMEEALKLGQSAQDDLRSGQLGLFGVEELEETAKKSGSSQLPDLPELPERERLVLEKSALGFYLSGHPLNAYRDAIEKLSNARIKDLAGLQENREVTVGGIVRSVRLMLTKRGKYEGKRMAFVKLEDFSGTIDCVIFASVYQDVAELVRTDEILFLRGEVDTSRSEPSLKVNEVIGLDRAKSQLTRRLTLRIKGDLGDDLDLQIVAIKRMLRDHPGRIPLVFEIETADFGRVTVQAGNGFRVSANEALFEDLESVLGRQAIVYN